MRLIMRLFLGLALVLTLDNSASFAEPPLQPAQPNQSDQISRQLSVSGSLEKPLSLSLAEFSQLKQLRIFEFVSKKSTPPQPEKLKGLLLKDLIPEDSLIAPGHNDKKSMVLIAKATDGYQVSFSWSEVYNSPLGEGMVVFVERNGQALNEHEGQFALISMQDLRTGPRHVKWLKEIEVRKLL